MVRGCIPTVEGPAGLAVDRTGNRLFVVGRFRNELQTLCAEAIEYLPGERMRVHFDRLDDEVMAADKRALIKEVLGWYRDQHPVWFGWLEW